MNPALNDKTRLEELFVEDHLFGLTAEDYAELRERLKQADTRDLHGFREQIAMLDLIRSEEEMAKLPETVRQSVLRFLRGTTVPANRSRLAKPSSHLAWFFTAASLLVAVTALATMGVFRQQDRLEKSVAQQRNDLLVRSGDAIQLAWSDGPTPIAGARGDVVWSGREQRGYMRFQGLKVNDPNVEQYQLWIFDRNQDEKTPIDGGVFNVANDGEVVIPIHASLNVREPYLFAITIEKPGGVVVSDRKRLPLLATVRQ
ncbi:MAG: anti-sigma factor [Gemmataceae bacterium]